MEEKMLELQNVSNANIKIIGAELKRRRVTRSKTLVNSSATCSISYISKIENGKIIPKLHILMDLCEEQGLSKKELETLLKVDELIEKSVEAMFWNNKEKITEIYNEICLFDNYKVNLIKTIYEMQFFHWSNVDMMLNSIYIIKDNLEEKDLYLFHYLQMCYSNFVNDYPNVYKLYTEFKFCKNEYLLALAAKEKFISVALYGLENPIYAYEEYCKKYIALFNYATTDMHQLLIETLINQKVEFEENVKNELHPQQKLRYLLALQNIDEIEDFVKSYSLTPLEKLLVATAKNEYSTGEKLYKKIQLHKLCAQDVIIANYCNYINKGNDDDLANFLTQVAFPYAIEKNDGILFKMFLIKLSEISFLGGRYKAVAEMNLKYFEMKEKCINCSL